MERNERRHAKVIDIMNNQFMCKYCRKYLLDTSSDNITLKCSAADVTYVCHDCVRISQIVQDAVKESIEVMICRYAYDRARE